MALFLVVAGAASGETGDVFRLGGRNAADKISGLRNTGGGPALELIVEGSAPPFSVSSSGLIPRLNASLLGGKSASDFAPVSGSSNYAPASGSPNYAAAGFSYSKNEADARYARASGDPDYEPANTTYTKSESDNRYAPATGSRIYADKDEVYTRRQTDERYAPATGSPNYLSSSAPQMLYAGTIEVELKVGSVNASIVEPTAVFAPSDGVITIIVSGYCTRGNTGELALRAQVGKEDAFTSYEVSGACATVAYKPVKKDETISVAAFLTTKVAGTGSGAIATAQVLFQPAKPEFQGGRDQGGGRPLTDDDTFPPRIPVRG